MHFIKIINIIRLNISNISRLIILISSTLFSIMFYVFLGQELKLFLYNFFITSSNSIRKIVLKKKIFYAIIKNCWSSYNLRKIIKLVIILS